MWAPTKQRKADCNLFGGKNPLETVSFKTLGHLTDEPSGKRTTMAGNYKKGIRSLYKVFIIGLDHNLMSLPMFYCEKLHFKANSDFGALSASIKH